MASQVCTSIRGPASPTKPILISWRRSQKRKFGERWPMANSAPLIRLADVSKTFGEVQSLRDVNFEIGQNEIVGLLGDNGAGKSTMVKLITGYHQPDPGGQIYWK